MELLNVSFFILVLKVSLCTSLGLLAMFLIFARERVKRRLRDRICFYLFGLHKAINYREFNKFLKILGFIFCVADGLLFWLLFF